MNGELLYLLTAADCSLDRSAIPARKIGFFHKLRTGLMTRSAIEDLYR